MIDEEPRLRDVFWLYPEAKRFVAALLCSIGGGVLAWLALL